MIHDGRMFFVEQTWSPEKETDICQLRFGTINETTGDFTEGSGSPVLLKEGHGGWIKPPVHHPVNNYLYILDCGDHWEDRNIDSVIYKSSDTYDALTGSTTFTKIVPPGGSSQSPRQYEALGIAPDGILFLAGWQKTHRNHHESVVVYSNDDGASWETGSRDEYCWAWQGPNFAFLDDGSGGYDIVTGTMISEDGGATWGMLPRTGNVWPHPGAIAFDPNAENTFYVRTDRGIAVTIDGGYSFSKAWTRTEKIDIRDIEVIDLGGDKSGIFISENEWDTPGQPSNSVKIYYAEIDHSTIPPTYGDFQIVPGMGDGSNWEIWSQFAGDSTSGLLFFEGTPNPDQHEESGLYRTDGKTAPTLVEIESGYASRPLIYDGHMFFVDSSWGGGYWVDGYWVDGYWEGDPQWVEGYEDAEGNWIEGHWTEGETWVEGYWVEGYWVEGYWVEGDPASKLYFGIIGVDGTFTASGEAEITGTAGLWPERMVINPNDDCIYILSNNWEDGADIFKSSDAYDALSSSTTFTRISPPSDGDTSYDWHAFGIGPDGQLFIAGWARSGMGENTIAYSENDGDSWETVSLENEYCGIGEEFAFLETSTGYDTLCGTMVSDDKGISWANLPRKDDNKAYPSSACVQVDPHDPQVLYIPTSKGIGYSADAGYHFYDINDGIEAVQIKDLVLDPLTGNGWAVAKSGVYRVFDLDTTNPVWSSPMDPDGEGAWYDVVEMDLSDETGNTAYVGTEWGDRLFKTTDGGDHWKSLWRPQPQFDPEDLPDQWCWPNWCGAVSAIEVDPYDSSRLFVGYDTGRWGWGEDQEERVFGQLWVIEEGSGELPEQDGVWMLGPQHGKDWSQILLYRDETENVKIVENNEGSNTWYALKGDINIHDILITRENGETVIYIAASYSDETATPVSDENKMHEGLYDSYGYPLVYDIYRITGDSSSGWNVESDFGIEDSAITTLAMDSNGILYAYGRDYDDETYQRFIDDYYDECRKEMIARNKEKARQEFYSEVHDGFYDEVIARLYAMGEGHQKSHIDEWEGHFEETFIEFYDKYFDAYAGEYNNDFDAYFDECLDEYFQDRLLEEFNKHFDEEMERENHFDDYWKHNKPAPGLRIVYRKALGGDWDALSMDGLNKAFDRHHNFDHNPGTMTIGTDPADSAAEVPYIAFSRFIYYLPSGTGEWVLGREYPMGTEIYVIVSVTSPEGTGALPASLVESVSTASSGHTSTGLASLTEILDLTPRTVFAAEVEGTYLYVGTATGIYGQLIVPSADDSSSEDILEILRSNSGIIVIATLIVIAGGIMFSLLKRGARGILARR